MSAGVSAQRAHDLRQRLMNPPNAVPDFGITMHNGWPVHPVVVEMFHGKQQHIHSHENHPQETILQANRHDRWPGKTLREIVRQQEGAPTFTPGLTVAKIKKAVAEHYDITLREMDGQSRLKRLAFVRQVAMYLCKKLLERSLPDIGRRFGDRDHTTVLHAVRKIERLRARDAELAALLNEFEATFSAE